MSFVHLQVRSGYTFMRSTVKINQLVKKAKQDGMAAIALTDHNVLHGAIEFYRSCKQEEIQPIIGMETTVEVNGKINNVLVLAKNNQGYQSLLKISSMIQTAEEKQIQLTEFTKQLKECILILPIETTQLRDFFNENDPEMIRAFLQIWPEQPLIGINRFELDLIGAASQLGVDLVALGDVRYVEKTDQQAYRYLRAMDQKVKLVIQDTQRYQHFFTQTEANAYFQDQLKLIEKTQEIADQCQVSFDFDQQHLPKYPVPEDKTAHVYLRERCEQMLIEKYSTDKQEAAQARLDYELSVIESMDFSDYFLIVWDFVRFAKTEGILVGPGRGSAAGSLVAYLLEITNIDPIQYNLLFERFLNPERISMPDIDIDFSDYRRNEVIEYVKGKYGYDSVAQIGTFGSFKTRSTIRELAKAFDLANEDLTFILNEIPGQGAQSVGKTIKQSQSLLDYINHNPYLKDFFKVASVIEDLPRNMSTHPAGVIIHDHPLVEFVPLITDGSGNKLTQFAMDDVERIGLLKMDFLGLRNLTTIERIMKMIARYEGNDLDLEQIPLDDSATYTIFQTGKTNGIFQFESQGMKNVLTRLKPTHFEDVVAVNALYRPGPMDFIDTYINRKNNRETVSYMHPDLKPILNSTYGVLIYQEQIIQLAHRFAGLSLGKADILRRAVSKKDRSELEDLKQQFIDGCLNKGYSQKIADELFSWIVRFANYGFNRSHAVAYSMIAYYLAYFKANYPVYFIVELLNTVIGEQTKTANYIKEAQQNNLTLLAPTINKSHYYYQPENGQIRMGLSSIKRLSYPIVNEIIQVRKKANFKSLFDFCMRINLKIVNRGSIETLILAGAFDEFGVERASLLASVDQAIEQGELFGGMDDQESFFGHLINLDDRYQEVEPFDLLEKLSFEKELLGLYVSDHPLEVNRRKLRANGIMDWAYFYQNRQVKNISFATVIQKIKQIRTKRGDSMAFIEFSDEKLEVDGVIFPDLYREVKLTLNEQMFCLVKGKKELRNGKEQLIVEQIEPLDLSAIDSMSQPSQRLFIQVGDGSELQTTISLLEELANQYPGRIPIIIHQKDQNKTFQLAESYAITNNYRVLNTLKKQLGNANVVLK
ncbi:MAG TPA: DNA polymerase III subunit alpha [Bacilli bacterium]|nr:DNA polymerase III subunit alpha [Bacilli bacterium]